MQQSRIEQNVQNVSEMTVEDATGSQFHYQRAELLAHAKNTQRYRPTALDVMIYLGSPEVGLRF